ncbi:MAG: response regulator [Candidatus Omnitrophota bacterium]
MEKKKILLVDDERDLVETMIYQLEAFGYQVITAYDGAEGLEKAKTEKPDLIILDLMLPKMDGYKVCGLLKKDTRYSRIPVILFTARAQESDMKLGEEVGADAYIVKPFESKMLLSKIESLLKSGS